MEKLISFDLRADFGFLKKPDVNDGLQLSYNMLHKPALLGILGAIAGLRGYEEKGQFPEYYERLKSLRVGIAPLEGAHERGNFTRTVITYTNTVGYANADGTLIVKEHTLCRPAYRCFVSLDVTDEVYRRLYDRIRTGEAAYVPYLGKNECHAWWLPEEVQEWAVLEQAFKPKDNYQVNSLFVRQYPLKDHRQEPDFNFATMSFVNVSSFSYFERLPLYFREEKDFVQYELAEFAYTDWWLKPTSKIADLLQVKNERDNTPQIIQLF